MEWTHVQVHFDEFWGRYTSHNSMAVNIRMLHWHGHDVAKHILNSLMTRLESFASLSCSSLQEQPVFPPAKLMRHRAIRRLEQRSDESKETKLETGT